MNEVAKLGDGMAFGELALLHNKPRAASIYTLEDTHFAVMNKRDFDRIMHKIKMRENNQLVEFLDLFEYFKSLTYQSKIKLAYWGVDKHFTFGQKVFEEETNIEYVYLIKSGEFELLKEVYINEDPSTGVTFSTFRRMKAINK